MSDAGWKPPAIRPPRIDFDAVRRGMEQLGRALAAAVEPLRQALARGQAPPARSARITRMRAAYRRKTSRRW